MKAKAVEGNWVTGNRCAHYASDPHNFGQRVERVDVGGEVYFVKPRPIFWEFLFFGKKSPLAPMFDKPIGIEGSKYSFRGLLFQLQFKGDVYAPTGGMAQEVVGIGSHTEPTEIELYSYGCLLAYSFIFGIHDLHAENLKRVKTGLMPIDVEAAFMNFRLPCETLLYPMPGSTHKKYGIHLLYPGFDKLSPDELRPILQGYLDIFEFVDTAHEHIVEVLNASLAPAIDLPIRVIFRNTKEYLGWLENGLPENKKLMAEEVDQLRRGDVPYFFRQLSDSDLSWYSGQSTLEKVDSESAMGTPWPVEELLDRETLAKMKLPTGCLHLCQRYLDQDIQGHIYLENTQIDCSGSEIKFIGTSGGFSCWRKV